MSEAPDIRRHVIVRGRVQGVFYRASTEEQAAALGLGGWVRNLSDGSVEAVFEGPATSVERMIEWCRKGPTHARVDEILVDEEEPRGEKPPFEVRYA